MKIKYLLASFALLLWGSVYSQDDLWWNEIHGWEPGMPGWRSFMIISPGYLGINALPIPTQLKGEIPISPELEFAVDGHFLKGENATNIFIRYLHPFQNGRIAVEIFGVPVEYFNHNEQIRDERKSRMKFGEGWAVGDLYFATHLKLIDEKVLPSVVLRLACKTASGDLHAARYTDTPAYWFDFSSGKSFHVSNAIDVRLFGMIGFYVWQTTSTNLLQNDAKLWGGGFEVKHGNFRIENSLQGYKGWREEKDCPINYRTIAGYRIHRSELKLEYQHGIQDVLYKSIRLAWVQQF